MRAARRILGVIVGYVIFAVAAVLLFQLTRRNPHAAQPMVFMAVSVAYGIVFAMIGGYVSAALGGGSPRVQGAAVAFVIALGATVSMPLARGPVPCGRGSPRWWSWLRRRRSVASSARDRSPGKARS